MSDFTEVIVGPDITDVLIVGDITQIASVYDTTVIIFAQETQVVSSGTAGPQGATGAVGPQGPPGPAGSTSVVAVAGEAVSAGRVLTITPAGAFYFDGDDISQYGYAVGVSANAAVLGDDVTIGLIGPLLLTGIGFTPNARFWAGTNGTLLTTPPVTGMIVPIGYAVDSDTLNIQVGSYLVI